jgi:polyisoprenoid-binding protein YceI
MRTLIAISTLAFAAGASAEPLSYTFDKVHTQVHASVLHMGLSNSTARFAVKDGSIEFDAADWSSAKVDVTLNVAGINLGDATWQEHVSAEKWFNVAAFPDARFVSTKVEKTGDNTMTISGDLTLKGATQPVTLQATVNKAGPHPFSKKPALGISAAGTIKRSEFGISEYLGGISDEVQIRIEIEAVAG